MLPFLVFAGGCALVLFAIARLAARARRKGVGGGSIMNPVDEIFHPVAYEARIEIQAQEDQLAPLPSPDGEGGPRQR